MRWLTDFAYMLLALLTLPLWLPTVLLRDKYRTHAWERFGGAVPRRTAATSAQRPLVWIHAVSVGEVRAAEPLVRELQAAFPHVEIAVSATTKTGRATAREVFADRVTFQFPLDFSWCVARVLRRLRPCLVVLMELEVWPNLVRTCTAHGVAVAVANGRLSDRSYPGYRRFRWLLGPVFRQLALVLAQTPAIAERFVAVGVPAALVQVVGSVKYDALPADAGAEAGAGAPQRAAERARLGVADDEVVVVAGSTHPPEHEPLIRCWQALRAEGLPLRLILVPRHPEKPQPYAYLAVLRVEAVRLSAYEAGQPWPAAAVLVGDVMGRLLRLYAAADVAFVGKSLPQVAEGGGQNPLEPAALGVATLFGPRMRNFDAIADDLLRREAAWQVADEAALLDALRRLLRDDARRAALGRNARAAVQAGRGATARHVAELAAAFGQRLAADAPAPAPAPRPGSGHTPAHT